MGLGLSGAYRAAGMQGELRKIEQEKIEAAKVEADAQQRQFINNIQLRQVGEDELTGGMQRRKMLYDMQPIAKPPAAPVRLAGMVGKGGGKASLFVDPTDPTKIVGEQPEWDDKATPAGKTDKERQGDQMVADAIGTLGRLRTMPGRSGAVGAPNLTAMGLGNAASELLRGRPIGGTDEAGFARYVEQLKAQLTLPNLQLMSGTGPLSDTDVRMISSAASALSRDMSEKAFESELNNIDRILNDAVKRRNIGMPKSLDPMSSHEPTGGAQAGQGDEIDAAEWLRSRGRR